MVMCGRLRMQDILQVWQHLKCLFGKGYKKKKVPENFVCGKCAKETVDMLPTVQVCLDPAKDRQPCEEHMEILHSWKK